MQDVTSLKSEDKLKTAGLKLGSFWVFLLFGIAIRMGALQQPLVDAMMYRQVQTACMTQGIAERPGWSMISNVHWRGDRNAQVLLELPLYNYLVLGVNWMTRDLDMAGKLTSILLWGVSFFLIQNIWRRLLRPVEIFWANLLFVLCPLEVFYGQAFMPEMLVQALSFGFILGLLSYYEQPSTTRFLIWAVLGLIGMLVKVPAFLHLYVLAAMIIFRRERWRSVLNWRYWAAVVVTAAAVKAWGYWSQQVNATDFPDWTPSATVVSFVGSLQGRIQPWRIFKLVQYPLVLIFTIPGTVFVLIGAKLLWQQRNLRGLGARITIFWIAALAFFYLFWAGIVAWTQAYYNLVAVPVFCILFSVGVCAVLEWGRSRSWSALQPECLAPMIVCILFPFLMGGIQFQFQQDQRVLYDAAIWLRDHTPAEDIILVKANHHPNMVQDRNLNAVSYYSGRRTWPLTSLLSAEENEHAVQVAKWALVTEPPTSVGVWERWRRAVRKTGYPPEDMSWLLTRGFKSYLKGSGFTVYQKTAERSN